MARLYGVLPVYRGQGGVLQRPSPEAILGVTRALGAEVRGPEDVAEAVRARRAERWRPLAGPVAVAWDGEPAHVPLRLLEAEARGTLDCRLALEHGETREWRAAASALAAVRARVADGRTRVAGRLPLPAPLPHGYHELTVRAGGREGRTWIVAAPGTTWDGGGGRDLGLFLPLYALRTGRSWGTADLTDLRALLEWSGQRGARFVGTLPLLASFLSEGRGPFEPSPYAPVSRLFWNELYLDVERAPGLDEASGARALLASAALQREVERLREAPRVQYGEAAAAKRAVLETLVGAVCPVDRPLPQPLAEYARARPEAEDYARFRAAGERMAASWREWPERPRGGALRDEDVDPGLFRYHLFAQWAMDRQMEALAGAARRGGEAPAREGASQVRADPALPALYFDLPLGAHPDGFDVWRHRSAFALELSGGAPPDAFFAGGQDWGFPPLHPERTREDCHAYTRLSLSHLMRSAGMLRLDHVMSLHRLYCVPAGHGPADGAYVRYPAEELYAILCLESHRWRCEVVGEDLGTVPEAVQRAMARHRLRRMYVLPFELEPLRSAGSTAATEGGTSDAPRLPPPPPLSVASLGTHDLPPFAAFWTGDDIEARLLRGLLGDEDAMRQRDERRRWRQALAAVLEAHADVGAGGGSGDGDAGGRGEDAPAALAASLLLLAASPARHLLVNVEDLWGEREPQNVPGTAGDENWTRRARHPLERWSALPAVEETLAALLRARRLPPWGEGSAPEQGAPPGASAPETNPEPSEAERWPTR